MAFDTVHTCQGAFRVLLESLSRPGLLESLGSPEDFPTSTPQGWSSGLHLLALTFLDARTQFWTDTSPEASAQLVRETYAVPGKPDTADFLWITGQPDTWGPLILSSKEGTLEDPQGGATLVVQVDDLEAGETVVLSGPGIRGSLACFLPFASLWVGARREKNREFPLGVDMVFTDRKGRVMALPRTTEIREE